MRTGNWTHTPSAENRGGFPGRRTSFKMAKGIRGGRSGSTSLRLEAELGPLPVPPFGVVPDLVLGGLEPEPLGQRPVLLLLPGEDLFDLEGLVGRHFSVVCKFDLRL